MSPTRLGRLEAPVRLVLKYTQALAHQDVDGMMRLVTDGCVLETSAPAPNGATVTGRSAIERYVRSYLADITEVDVDIEEIFGFGNRCVMRFCLKSTLADGSEQNIGGVGLFKVKTGLIDEQLCYRKGIYQER